MSIRKTRNDTTFWYCLLIPGVQEAILDEHGNETGETIPAYDTAVAMNANISPAAGIANTEQFGNLTDYDRVIVTTDMDCPIDENTVLFLDGEPNYTTVQAYELVEATALYGDDEVEPVTYDIPKYDHVVRRVARSKNVIAYAVRQVSVT